MQRKSLDVWVGLFVVLGAAALLFLALKAGNLLTLNFDDTYAVNARFDNIGGLKPQAAVKSAGVVVGRVQSIGFDDKAYQANVVLQMNKKFVFPKDTSAKILTSGLLGEQYLGLEPGGDEKNLVAGDTIRSTQSAVVHENLISQFLFNKAAEPPPNAGGGSTGSATSLPAPGIKK
jgi:phospholipid/cholesterol/gamma-HCH transport system substrate-binding protein